MDKKIIRYPVRLGGEQYRRLRTRARKEKRTIASLIREGTDIATGNPTISAQLSTIREELTKLSCSSEVNRTALAVLAENLAKEHRGRGQATGEFDRERFERDLAVFDAILRGVRIHGIKNADELREFVSDIMEGEDRNK